MRISKYYSNQNRGNLSQSTRTKGFTDNITAYPLVWRLYQQFSNRRWRRSCRAYHMSLYTSMISWSQEGTTNTRESESYYASSSTKECCGTEIVLRLLWEVNSRSVDHCGPFESLLCKNARWKWTDHCQEAFQQLKSHLASHKVLVHYDPSLPIKLASACGVGAVLSHVFPDGTERPISYASRTLTKSEKGYSQLEKEALS